MRRGFSLVEALFDVLTGSARAVQVDRAWLAAATKLRHFWKHRAGERRRNVPRRSWRNSPWSPTHVTLTLSLGQLAEATFAPGRFTLRPDLADTPSARFIGAGVRAK